MKYINLLLFLLLGVCSFEQTNPNYQGQSVFFHISNYKSEISDEKELTFNLIIKNISNEDIKIPSKYSVAPNESAAGNIGYEVYYCDIKDTINFTELIIANHDDFGLASSYKRDFDLKRGSSYNIQALLESLYFWKKGTYKVRFVLKKDSFHRLISNDVYTDWVFLTVTNDIWPLSKNGLFPAMRQ